jgi:hypothetical protein
MSQEETLENQRANAQQMVNQLLDKAKAEKMNQKNKEFFKTLIEPEPIVQPTIYSDIKLINNWGIDVVVPESNTEYWNLVVIERKVIMNRLKECQSQTTFEILLKDYNDSFNKLTDEEKKLYL